MKTSALLLFVPVLAAGFGISLTTVPATFAAPGDITTVVGNHTTGAIEYGLPATSTGIGFPYHVAVDSKGNLFVASQDRPVRKIDGETGLLSHYAGKPGLGVSGDGGPAIDAEFMSTSALAIDRSGNLYIADTQGHQIRKIDRASGIISTIAGTGVSGHSGDGGPATDARLNLPNYLFIDTAGNVYFADDDQTRIRRVDAGTGTITTIAGNGTEGGTGDDGPAVDAAFNLIRGLCLDRNGDLIVVDSGNHRIRRIDLRTGIVMSLNLGAGPVVDDVDMAQARFYYPFGVVMDGKGNLFFGDSAHYCVRRLDAETNRVTTIAGTTVAGYTGDGGPATEAMIGFPQNLAMDAKGNLYIAEYTNYVVRKIEAAGEPVQFQPDNAVGKKLTSLKGRTIHNQSGSGQTQKVRSNGRSARFYFSAQDDTLSNFTDSLWMRATKGDRNFKIKYIQIGAGNVTAGLVNGLHKHDPEVAGRESRFKALVRAKYRSGSKRRTIRIASQSNANTSGRDTVKARVLIRK